jgi:hypothetical protein
MIKNSIRCFRHTTAINVDMEPRVKINDSYLKMDIKNHLLHPGGLDHVSCF